MPSWNGSVSVSSGSGRIEPDKALYKSNLKKALDHLKEDFLVNLTALEECQRRVNDNSDEAYKDEGQEKLLSESLIRLKTAKSLEGVSEDIEDIKEGYLNYKKNEKTESELIMKNSALITDDSDSEELLTGLFKLDLLDGDDKYEYIFGYG